MEVTQILLVVTVLVLTAILSVIGFEVFLILKEVRQSFRKMNKILDDAGLISESVAKPIAGFSNLTLSLRSLGEFVRGFVGGGKEVEESATTGALPEPKEKPADSLPESSPRRFFHRAGKKLS